MRAYRPIGLVALAFAMSLPAMAQTGVQLSCGDDARNLKIEAKAMAQAPLGAKRPSAHVLEVTLPGGVKKFTDKPPYNDGLSGRHWYYCGYDSGLHAHLIGENDESLFSGKLLLDGGGNLLDAGKSVSIAPDKTKFVATEQPDGQDGETWTVRDLQGKKLWSGYAGILKDQDMVYAEFINPRWSAESVLTADVACGGGDKPTAQISLKMTDTGLKWSPEPKCEMPPK